MAMARTRGASGKTYVPAADRFVHQFSGDRAVDATANGADNATSFSADLTYASNLLSYKLFLYVCCGGEVEIRARNWTFGTYHGPVTVASADVEHESGDDLLPPRRVRHLGVELDAVEGLRVVRDRSKRRRFRVADDMEFRRRRRELVAM